MDINPPTTPAPPDPTPGADQLIRTPTRPVPRSANATLRVRYCECDPMGVAHHAAYVPWLEIARTEILRDAGVSYADLEAAGVFLVIVRLDLRYRRPILYDDLVLVHARVVSTSRVKIEHEYDISLLERSATLRGNSPAPWTPGDPLAAAKTTLARVDHAGRPAPLPDWLAGAAP